MTAVAQLIDDFSLEITGKDVLTIAEARQYIPDGARVHVTFLESEAQGLRIAAAQAIGAAGLSPVAHVAARRIGSPEALESFLGGLEQVGAGERLFLIGGDPEQPAGPYADALSLIRSGALIAHGVKAVGIAGYPEGHPRIAEALLWQALTEKATTLAELGIAGELITQFGFDVDAVISWIEQLRRRGVGLPIRVGVPGPAGVKRLLAYARRFGVGSSAGIARKYGLSLGNLLAVAGPERFISDLASRLDPGLHGSVKLHFYTFGGIRATAQWAQEHGPSTI